MKQQNFNIIAIFESETEDSSSLFFPTYTEDLNINISSLKEFCVAFPAGLPLSMVELGKISECDIAE